MAKDSGNSLITLGGLAVAAYFAYEYFFKPTTAATALPPTGATNGTGGQTVVNVGSGTPAVTTPPASTATKPSNIDSLYSAMKAEVVKFADPNFTGSGDAMSSTPYRWNVYLQRVYTGTIPDVATLFTDTNANVSAEQFWATMGPALRSANSGLSGLWPQDWNPAMVGAGW